MICAGWAVSTGRDSKHESINTLRDTTAALSRYGSGCHVMAFVLADQQQWLSENQNKDEEKAPFAFKEFYNFKAMRDAVNDDTADYFMWEKFTTKPYHDSGEVKSIGEITPSWPAFLFAAHTDLLKENIEGLKKVLSVIQTATTEFRQDEDTATKSIVDSFEYQKEDVSAWLKTVRYPTDHFEVSRQALEDTIKTLGKAGVVDSSKMDPASCCAVSVARLV